MTGKDAFDLWWEWAEKPVDSILTIPVEIHDADLRRSRSPCFERLTEIAKGAISVRRRCRTAARISRNEK